MMSKYLPFTISKRRLLLPLGGSSRGGLAVPLEPTMIGFGSVRGRQMILCHITQCGTTTVEADGEAQVWLTLTLLSVGNRTGYRIHEAAQVQKRSGD